MDRHVRITDVSSIDELISILFKIISKNGLFVYLASGCDTAVLMKIFSSEYLALFPEPFPTKKCPQMSTICPATYLTDVGCSKRDGLYIG